MKISTMGKKGGQGPVFMLGTGPEHPENDLINGDSAGKGNNTSSPIAVK